MERTDPVNLHLMLVKRHSFVEDTVVFCQVNEEGDRMSAYCKLLAV